MSDFLKDWFKWFEQGINVLDDTSKEKFFSQCSANCMKRGALQSSQELFTEAGRDLDTFFMRASEKEYANGYIIESEKVYELTFSHCTCELVKQEYIESDFICECSRQGIIHVMKALEPELNIEVEKRWTILGGADECRFRIKIN